MSTSRKRCGAMTTPCGWPPAQCRAVGGEGGEG
jgi:hypothetical protein